MEASEGQQTELTFELKEKKKLLESALYMAPKTISFPELKEIIKLTDENMLLFLLNELRKEYLSRDSALEVIINSETRHAALRPKSEYLVKVKQFTAETELHKGIQKTLALIAYKQPIKQSLVIKYRNNKAYDHIKYLLEKGLIRKEKQGRTFILSTTKKFLDYFNLEDLKRMQS